MSAAGSEERPGRITGVVAVAVVRDGALPAGTDEAAAEAGGRIVLVGSGVRVAAAELRAARHVWCAEAGPFAPGAWSRRLEPVLHDTQAVILPASADGRDLAPRLAHEFGRPLLAGAIAVGPEHAVLAREGGLVTETRAIVTPVVATLEPGVRGVEVTGAVATVHDLELGADPAPGPDAEVIEVLPPDPATVDLGEATRIVAGGAGLGGPAPFEVLRRVAARIGASWGGSRVAADAGWIPQDRFIGTTGATTTAGLYVALGISGAVQHVTGLGDPDHIIAVNLDSSAPMMAMADLAIVTDARELLDELDRALPPIPDEHDPIGLEPRTSSPLPQPTGTMDDTDG